VLATYFAPHAQGEFELNIDLKMMGDQLHASLIEELPCLNLAYADPLESTDAILWTPSLLSQSLRVDNLLCYPDRPSALIIDTEDPALIDRLQIMEKRDFSFIKDPPFVPIVLAPLVLVFRSPSALADMAEFPDFVSDWVCAPFTISDLLRRVVVSLKRKNILKTRLRFGPLTLIPETRTAGFEGRTIHLTPSEFSLAELFMNQMGSVIPMKDLISLFKSTGKSTEGSNIRVTIFQLRLKLEMLTQSAMTLASVYKKGYCLKQKLRGSLHLDRKTGSDLLRS
jgi:DNA-binding winged helix-turn-helix (wHTH) protein